MPRPQHKAILFVQDRSEASAIESALLKLGYEITAVHDPGEAEGHIRSSDYSLAILTRPFPGLSWRESLAAARGISADLCLIAIARNVTEADLRDALNAGSYIVLEEPAFGDSLAALIDGNRQDMFVVLRE